MATIDRSKPVLAADGTPLKRSLARALRRQKARALLLIAPLLVIVLVTFLSPIADMLFRSVENSIVRDTLSETIRSLESWDPASGNAPSEDVFEALYVDIFLAQNEKLHTRLGARLNYERTGMSSLFRKTGRGVKRLDVEAYRDVFLGLNENWGDPKTWVELFGHPGFRADLPLTTRTWDHYSAYMTSQGRDIAAIKVEDVLFVALYIDLRQADVSTLDPRLQEAARALENIEPVSFTAAFEEISDDWLTQDVWQTIHVHSPVYTSGYFLNAVDMQKNVDGVSMRPENQQLYLLLFGRTFFMSLVITGVCILLGYPVAWLLANLPTRKANLLLILVLLPFWTSLLVRTSAWKVMLQQQGVINDVLVWVGLVDDAGRLIMINNQLGTIIAMTHILLPFMILPLYSVMQTIPATYVRAAKSLGATNWIAFRRIYFPQSVPGIGAGSILVFILAIGYYITPEIVGGTTGTFISNRIAYHISSSLNWGLAAALGVILLVVVLVLYWVYDKIVGIDNVKLG